MALALEKVPPETKSEERLGRLQELKLRVGDMKIALFSEVELNRFHVHTEPFTLNEIEESTFKL